MKLLSISTCQINLGKLDICKVVTSFLFSALATSGHCVELTIYTENWPPISFQHGDKVDGMAVEVVDALQKKMGTNSAIHLVPWARGYKAVLEDPNVMLFTVGRSAEREKQMTFIGPVAISKTVLYTRKGNAKRLLSLGDKIYSVPVGAYRDSIFADVAVKKGFHTLDLAATPQITAKMLMMNRFDLWSEGSVVVPSVLKDIGYSGDDVEKVMILDSLELFLAFSAKTPLPTLKLWEEAMRQIKKDGTFQKIHEKWLPNEPVPMDVYRIGINAS